MNRFKIEGIFILILTVVTAILFNYVPMDKLTYYDMGSTNYVYTGILYLTIACLIAFNYYVLDYPIWLNIVVTVVFTIISRYAAKWIVGSIVNKLNIAWPFQYKWLELLVVGVIMILLTELILWMKLKASKE